MTNIRLPLEQYADVEIHNVYKERTEKGYDPEAVMESIWARGRDNARTPMQWDDSDKAGFTTVEPWLPIHDNHTEINVEAALADPDSIYHYYKKLIQLRKTYSVFRDGAFTLLDPADDKVFAYTRDNEYGHLLVVCNFTDEWLEYELPEEYAQAEVLLTNYREGAPGLRPYEAAMFYYEEERV